MNAKIMKKFNPNDLGIKNNNIFGLPFAEDDVGLIILPVPWEVTISYRGGTAQAPAKILDASLQVDLYDPDTEDAWKNGIFMRPIDDAIVSKNKKLRELAKKCIKHMEEGKDPNDAKIKKIQSEVNEGGKELNSWVYKKSREILAKGKMAAVLGGDHSSPLGLMQALADTYKTYGILHIDAHADLRNSYEGFEYSHASIMFNALRLTGVAKLVQVGVRDYCEEEALLMRTSRGRIEVFLDRNIQRDLFSGKNWRDICREIIRPLPQNVYVSFDIDGFDLSLCPNTGTPVPGSLQFEQACYLLEELAKSHRKLIGFDLCEIAPGDKTETDVITGARILYRLANLALSL